MNIVSWILLGLLAGLIVHYIEPVYTSGGILGTIVVGILGALLGGSLAILFLGVGITGFDFPSLIIAVLGALLLIFISRAFIKRPL